MNIPVTGDINWLKSLQPGTPLFTANYHSDTNEVVIFQFVFDKYDTENKVKNPDEDTVYGFIHPAGSDPDEGVQLNSQKLNYGFFPTPLEAITAFTYVMEGIVKACKKAKKDEDKRLQKKINDAFKAKK